MINGISIYEVFPKFILGDKNGMAIAKAIGAGMNYFLEKCNDGLNCFQDVDEMPEWRLDELAWEYNILYDYNAVVAFKREWVRNAYTNTRIHGTPEGIVQYLDVYFEESHITEWFEGGLAAGKFDVVVRGILTDENERWLRASVEKAKNVRSVLNDVVFISGETEMDTTYMAAAIMGVEIEDTATITNTLPIMVKDIQVKLVSAVQVETAETLQGGP